MARDSYNDLVFVHQHLDEIVTFIQGIVQKESVAIVLACQVFEEHKKKAAQRLPLEKDRVQWLRLKARELAMTHLDQERREKQKTMAIQAAIHNYQ